MKKKCFYIFVLRSVFWLERPLSLDHVEAEGESIGGGQQGQKRSLLKLKIGQL
jgi:hypothetical protein